MGAEGYLSLFIWYGLWVIGLLVALSSFDDLFIDISAHARIIYRTRTIYKTAVRARSDTLPEFPERPIAILIPAWQECAVIGQMLQRLRSTLRYKNYQVFLGVYPNDPDTAIVARSQDPDGLWLHILSLDHPGPTSKGDCLNMLWHRISTGENYPEFHQFVLHDAEDLIHPDELKLFNFLADRSDMIQLPVIPLPCAYRNLVGGHYLDEFAESHQKDMVIREWFSGGVPSAGVGCAFSRQALQDVAHLNPDIGPFPQHSLTEDYELAMTLLGLGKRSIFVRIPDSSTRQALVATREYFPTHFMAAVRQKARWMVGIALQSWASQGWSANKATRYMQFRDRKTLITSLLTICGYGLVISYVLLFWVQAYGIVAAPQLRIPDGPLLMLLWLNLALLTNRAAHRAIYTTRLYGWRHGLLSVPRIIIGNFVNCAAAVRALRLYGAHRLLGKPLNWIKTDHKFPDAGLHE